MIRLLSQSLAIFASNLPALLGIALLIYLPVNVGLNLLVDESSADEFDVAAFQAYGLSEVLFGSLAAGFATVVAARSRMAEPVRFLPALGQAMRHWPAMVGATILFNIGVTLGLVALVIPGVYLALRWALIYPSIVLDDAGVNHSFSRSTWLSQGYRWQILGFAVLGLLAVSALTMLLYLSFEWLPAEMYFPAVIAIDTLVSWLSLIWPILLTLYFLEARAAVEDQDLPEEPYREPNEGDREVVADADNPFRSPQY